MIGNKAKVFLNNNRIGIPMSEAEENKFDPIDKQMKLPEIIRTHRSFFEKKEFTADVFL
jgi:hypothetical protein